MRGPAHDWRYSSGGEKRRFAKQEESQRLRQARYRHLANLTMQVLIVCMMVNCTRTTFVRKRMANFGKVQRRVPDCEE
jgi:hypothetical protein